jgi:hypothetical protein
MTRNALWQLAVLTVDVSGMALLFSFGQRSGGKPSAAWDDNLPVFDHRRWIDCGSSVYGIRQSRRSRARNQEAPWAEHNGQAAIDWDDAAVLSLACLQRSVLHGTNENGNE